MIRTVATVGIGFAVAHAALQRQGTGAVARAPHRSAGLVLVQDSFKGPDRLLSNEYAYHHPNRPSIALTPLWRVTSGSLFVHHGMGWTGALDRNSPGPQSNPFTDSAVFRMQTQRSDLGDVSLSFYLRNLRFKTTAQTPARRRDGVHIMLRWRSPAETYYLSVDRRDNVAVIKKKVPGGPTNGGTYIQVGSRVAHLVRLGVTERIDAQIRDAPDGSVDIRMYVAGHLLLRAVDRGEHGAPLSRPGRVGFRGDNDEFLLADVVIRQLR